jgi:hypothetical protein
VTVVRVGPTELRPSRAKPRRDELSRIFAGPVAIEEASTLDTLAELLDATTVAAVVVDAAPPGQLPTSCASPPTCPCCNPAGTTAEASTAT